VIASSIGWPKPEVCELNYTPERADGTIDISKAPDINVEFDLWRQL